MLCIQLGMNLFPPCSIWTRSSFGKQVLTCIPPSRGPLVRKLRKKRKLLPTTASNSIFHSKEFFVWFVWLFHRIRKETLPMGGKHAVQSTSLWHVYGLIKCLILFIITSPFSNLYLLWLADDATQGGSKRVSFPLRKFAYENLLQCGRHSVHLKAVNVK